LLKTGRGLPTIGQTPTVSDVGRRRLRPVS